MGGVGVNAERFDWWTGTRQINACVETGEQSTNGICRIHDGDACLYQYVNAKDIEAKALAEILKLRAERDELRRWVNEGKLTTTTASGAELIEAAEERAERAEKLRDALAMALMMCAAQTRQRDADPVEQLKWIERTSEDAIACYDEAWEEARRK
jgi:hypothetical protein